MRDAKHDVHRRLTREIGDVGETIGVKYNKLKMQRIVWEPILFLLHYYGMANTPSPPMVGNYINSLVLLQS